MSRLKVTAKGKVKKNIPITRIGKKQYLKRRFAHVRAVDVAGANNRLTQKYVAGEHYTASQGFSHLGLRQDASADTSKLAQTHLKIPQAHRKANLFKQEEEQIEQQEKFKKATYIGRPVSEQEGSMTAALLQTYGMDIKRMTYDHRLNPFQLNARQLQRQIVNYLKWEKAAFPKQFAEAERKGWFSVEAYADPKLRIGVPASHRQEENAVFLAAQQPPNTLATSSASTQSSSASVEDGSLRIDKRSSVSAKNRKKSTVDATRTADAAKSASSSSVASIPTSSSSPNPAKAGDSASVTPVFKEGEKKSSSAKKSSPKKVKASSKSNSKKVR